MKRSRMRGLLLALVLAAGWSCSGELPSAPQVDQELPTVDGGAAPGGDGAGLPTDTTAGTPTDTSGSTPTDSATGTPPDSTGGITPPDTTLGGSGGVPSGAGLLACDPQPYLKTTAVIGRKGGWIFVGDHGLFIPQNALSENVTITAEQVEGTVNSIRFSPEGLQFAAPAVLWLSYKNCVREKHSKSIVYIDETLNVLESFSSYDFNKSSHVSTLINHFSRYAVAY